MLRGAEAGLDKHHNSPGGSFEAATESAATQTVDRLVLEIENDRVVRSDVSVELGRRVQRVARVLRYGVAFGSSLSGKSEAATSAGVEFKPLQSMTMSLSDVLAKDHPSLPALVLSMADSPGEEASPEDAGHVAAFVKWLSSLVREEVSDDVRK